MQDDIYLKKIGKEILTKSRDNRHSTIIRDSNDLKKSIKDVYYPVSLSLPADSLDKIIESCSDSNKAVNNMINVVCKDGDEDNKEQVLTKDDSSFFLSQPIRKIIFAPPGSSKTLFTKRLVLYLTQANDPGLFPFYLQCSLLNESNDKKENFVKLAYDMQEISIPEKEFAEIINRHSDNALLIIDGLDECTEDDRKLIARSLSSFLAEHQNVGFVITARLRQYNKDELVDACNTQYHYIERLDDSDIFSYIKNWYSVFMLRKKEDIDTAKNNRMIEDIIDTLNHKCGDHIRSLIRIPMHLTNMLEISRCDCNKFPQSIDQYYKRYIQLKLRGVSSLESYLNNVIEYIAYWMSCCPQKRYVSVDEHTLTDSIISPHFSELDKKQVESLLDTLVNEMSVLTQVSLDRGVEYRFEHLSLQELLTAKALMSEDNTTDFDGYIRKDNPVNFIRRVTYDDGWKEYDQIMRYVLVLAKEDEREDIEYLLKKKGLYDSILSIL